MSELRKLKDEYHQKCVEKSRKMLLTFLIKMGELQTECKHELTHWMQELAEDGTIKDGLFKRCFVCGFTIETFNVSADIVKALLSKFDKDVEEQKLLEANKP